MGLIVLFVIGIYIALAISIVKMVYSKTESKKIRYSAIAIALFFPFWDMLLHYPVYWILSNTVPEIERYQPYEKVDGFYENYIPRGDIAFNMFLHDTFENNYSIYFDKPGHYKNEKFHYQASWLNDSSSPTCFQPQPGTAAERYKNSMKNNWCISVKRIEESEMTKYWKVTKRKVFYFPLLYMNIYVVDFFVTDRLTGEKFFRLRDVYVDRSWLTAVNIVSGRKKIRSGTKYTYARSGREFEFPDYNIIKILDSKELPKI